MAQADNAARGRLLIFVEDPGAANFVTPLVGALNATGWQTVLTAAGVGVRYLSVRNVGFTEIPAGASASELLRSANPDLVVVGTSENDRTLGLTLISEARQAGIATVAVIDFAANARHRFSAGDVNDPLKFRPDWILSSNDLAAGEFVALGFPHDRIVVTGHPYYEAVIEEGHRLRKTPRADYRRRFLPAIPDDRRVVVFLSEGSDGHGMDIKRKSADYTLLGSGTSDRRTEIVLEEFLGALDEMERKPDLVLRLHPKEKPYDYAALLPRFAYVSADEPPLPVLLAGDLVVGLSTSLLVEAALVGLKTLSILPSDKQRHLVPTVLSGQTPCVTNRESLRRLLPRLLSGAEDASDSGSAPMPAGAIKRAVDAIDRIASVSRH